MAYYATTMWLVVHNNQIELRREKERGGERRREEERGRVKAAVAFISTMTQALICHSSEVGESSNNRARRSL